MKFGFHFHLDKNVKEFFWILHGILQNTFDSVIILTIWECMELVRHYIFYALMQNICLHCEDVFLPKVHSYWFNEKVNVQFQGRRD